MISLDQSFLVITLYHVTAHVIYRFPINTGALTSLSPLCDVRRVNPRHFWSFIQGFNTLFYILGALWVDCRTCIYIGIKLFKHSSTPGLKGDPGRVTSGLFVATLIPVAVVA